jgi:transcriptional regulator with XRE-family HTH domain
MTTNMKTKIEEFEVLIPNLDGTDIAERVKVPITLEWDEEVKEWLLTPDAHQMIEETKTRRIGLLLPAQLKELRERYEYTQKEMGELFQVGEKSWTRWESGKHRPSRSINLIIRALYEGEISINYLLKRAGKPQREAEAFAVAKSPWFSICTTAEMPYVIVTKHGSVHFQTKGFGKSTFLKALLHQAVQQSASPWQALSVSKKSRPLAPSCPNKRFDYENVKLA